MSENSLWQIYLDQKQVFEAKRNLIDRDVEIENFLSTKQIVVISGVRRSGKSSLLRIIKDKLGLQEQDYCYFNFDDERITKDVSIFNELYLLHLQHYSKEPIFFFDEVQLVKGWEQFVNRMYESSHKVFVTGSNGSLLSSEISTSLTGRNKVLKLFPFSFKEYLRFVGHKYQIDALTSRQQALLMGDLNKYLSCGGFPLVVQENDLEILNSWFQDIFYRDIVMRYKITQVEELKQIALYLLSNTGKLFSYSTLQKISGVKSTSSIKNYLTYFERSYLLYFVRKFDYSLKKQIMNSNKVYAVDNGVINRLGFNFSENKGRLLENAVYLELLRKGKQVFYYSGKNECDFLILEGIKITTALQVCETLNEDNCQRELVGLKEAMQTFDVPQGIIICTQNTSNIKSSENIAIVPSWQWLLEIVN